MSGGKTNGHPEVWAFLTIITFPVVLIATDMMEIEGFWPFIYAAAATLAVLALEALVRGRLWPFENRFAEKIEHPATPGRILVFMGAILLILETTLIYIVAVDRRFDLELLSIIADKHCGRADSRLSASICRLLTPEDAPAGTITRGDAWSFAIQDYAAKKWFPGKPLVTCAERKIVSAQTEGASCRSASIVHCTSWKVDEQGNLAAAAEKTKLAGYRLEPGPNGLYRVAGWVEDPNEAQWNAVLSGAADKARNAAFSLEILPGLSTVLQAEALGRAQRLLKRGL